MKVDSVIRRALCRSGRHQWGEVEMLCATSERLPDGTRRSVVIGEGARYIGRHRRCRACGAESIPDCQERFHAGPWKATTP